IFDTERWALEFVPHDIRVNTVSPGSILVEGNGWDRYRLANPGYFEDYVRHGFPMGRLGAAEEVADVIAFLASPRAYWINGRNIPVDGLEQPHAPFDRRPFWSRPSRRCSFTAGQGRYQLAAPVEVVCGRCGWVQRSTGWRIVLRPPRRYQALRLWRTAARLRGLTPALRPSVWHPCLRRRSGSLEAGQAAH